MRRWIAILLLCLVTGYVGATSLDPCTDQIHDGCAPICHLSCPGGCATVPVTHPPVPPVPEPLPRPRYEVERTEDLVSLVLEPEKTPPRP